MFVARFDDVLVNADHTGCNHECDVILLVNQLGVIYNNIRSCMKSSVTLWKRAGLRERWEAVFEPAAPILFVGLHTERYGAWAGR